jgi:hypothetical protein
MLLVNLRMDAGYVREGMNINWKGEVRNFLIVVIHGGIRS